MSSHDPSNYMSLQMRHWFRERYFYLALTGKDIMKARWIMKKIYDTAAHLQGSSPKMFAMSSQKDI